MSGWSTTGSASLFIGETDTITDLADGFLGAAIGGVFLGVWAVARYTSRRLPARVERDVLSPHPTNGASATGGALTHHRSPGRAEVDRIRQGSHTRP
jgi:hypothetical protein